MDTPVSAKAALLQVLISGEGYGLDLIERVKTRTKGAVVLGAGSVYPALRELEREGLVESYTADASPERGGRPRVYYRITADGKRTALDHGTAVRGLFLTPAVAR
jgi:PadR family transcriptional regulator PadR